MSQRVYSAAKAKLMFAPGISVRDAWNMVSNGLTARDTSPQTMPVSFIGPGQGKPVQRVNHDSPNYVMPDATFDTDTSHILVKTWRELNQFGFVETPRNGNDRVAMNFDFFNDHGRIGVSILRRRSGPQTLRERVFNAGALVAAGELRGMLDSHAFTRMNAELVSCERADHLRNDF